RGQGRTGRYSGKRLDAARPGMAPQYTKGSGQKALDQPACGWYNRGTMNWGYSDDPGGRHWQYEHLHRRVGRAAGAVRLPQGDAAALYPGRVHGRAALSVAAFPV